MSENIFPPEDERIFRHPLANPRGAVIKSNERLLYEAAAERVNRQRGDGFVQIQRTDVSEHEDGTPLAYYEIHVVLTGGYLDIEGGNLASYFQALAEVGEEVLRENEFKNT
jgi:hypothetical protein